MHKILKLIFLLAAFLALFSFAKNIIWKNNQKFAEAKEFTITISDNGSEFNTETSAQNISGMLAEKNIKLAEKDYVFPAASAKIFPGSRITIQRAIPVSIAADGKEIKIDTTGRSVKNAIDEADITLSPVDKVTPEISSLLTPNLKIVVTRINIAEETVSEDVSFQTIQKEDNTVLWKKTAVKQVGVKGVREKKYKVIYTNGKETNRTLLASTITQAPVPEIDVVGTKIIVGKTETGAATWYVNGDDLTCASLDFAHGKYLRVTNRANGKSVIVQINDSGPYGKGRIIDLNKKAFQKIGDIGAGVINVKVEEILN